MAREVAEETGLSLDEATREEACHFISTDAGTVIFRRYFLAEDAATIAARIQDFVDHEADPEIDGPVVIRDPAALPEGLSPHMVPLVEWHFGKLAAGR